MPTETPILTAGQRTRNLDGGFAMFVGEMKSLSWLLFFTAKRRLAACGSAEP